MGLFQRSLMAKLFIYFILLGIVPLAIISYSAYDSGQRAIIDNVEAHLDSVAALKKQEIQNWVGDIKNLMAYLAADPVRQNKIDILTSHDVDDPEYVAAYSYLATEFKRIVTLTYLPELFLLDSTSGQIVISSDVTEEGKFRENEPYFIQGKSSTYASDIFHNLSMGQPTMAISSPVRDTSGQLLGVLVAYANLEHLSEVMLERSGLGKTGETLLVNKSNLLITNTVFAPEGAFKKWIFGEGAKWALEGKNGVDLFIDYRGEPVIGAYRWLEDRELALIAKQDQSEAFAPVNNLRNIIAMVAGIVLVVAVAVGLWFGRQITSPLARLADYARRVGKGEYTAEVEIKGEDEVASVASSVKSMVGQLLQMQEKLLESERLATLGQFSGNISHELRNPLGVIDSSAYYLKIKLKDADEKVHEHLDRIKASVGSSTATIESLLNLTRMEEPRLAKLDLNTAVTDAIATFKIPATVKIIKNFPEEEVPVSADREQLLMAFKNIIKNAHEAMDGKGTLTVTVGRTADGQAEVSFADSGPGIAAEDLEMVFQPLFSRKAKGIGFGLSITKLVVNKHGGTIEVKSEPGKGANITIKLPPSTDTHKEV